MTYETDNVAEFAVHADVESHLARSLVPPSIFAVVCRAQGALCDLADRRYYYSLICLLSVGSDPASLPGEEVALILRELDTAEPEEYLLTVAELHEAQPIGEVAWRIPALGWDLVFYRQIPIAHPGPSTIA